MPNTEMYICRDVTRKLVVSVYWEKNQLFIVAKSPADDGELADHGAWQYAADTAEELLNEISRGICRIETLSFERLVASAIAGRIAEGLIRLRRGHANRINPYLWN